MSTLLIEELNTGTVFTQPIRVSRNVSVKYIRPWVLLHGTLTTGDLQLRVLQGANVLVTKTINYVDLNAAKTEAYAHGYIRFDFESLILHKAEGEQSTEYILELSMINYSDDPNNYVGVVREWDKKSSLVYGDVDGSGNALNDIIQPAGYQIFEYRS